MQNLTVNSAAAEETKVDASAAANPEEEAKGGDANATTGSVYRSMGMVANKNTV